MEDCEDQADGVIEKLQDLKSQLIAKRNQLKEELGLPKNVWIWSHDSQSKVDSSVKSIDCLFHKINKRAFMKNREIILVHWQK